MSGNRSKSAFFEGVTLSADFRGKAASSTNHCWHQKTRVIAVSCGMKVSAVHHLVLSQYTRLTDRRTEFRQQYRALHYMQLHGKTSQRRCSSVDFSKCAGVVYFVDGGQLLSYNTQSDLGKTTASRSGCDAVAGEDI